MIFAFFSSFLPSQSHRVAPKFPLFPNAVTFLVLFPKNVILEVFETNISDQLWLLLEREELLSNRQYKLQRRRSTGDLLVLPSHF